MSRETSRAKASVRQVCEAFGISRQAFYAAQKPRRTSKGPRGGSHHRPGPWATAAEIEAGIREVVDGHPAWGVRKVWAVLRRRKLVVSCKRVYAMMKMLGLTLPAPAEREAPWRGGTVVVPESNRRWASDLTTAWTRQDGLVAVVPVVDCGDRVALACEVTKSQEAPSVLAPTEASLGEQFATPENVPAGLELRTDHGPQFTGADCEDLCRRWGVEHTLAPVGRPTGNAVAERFIQTLKVELVWTRDWESIEELRAAIRTWLDEYNHRRPHQALGWMTPAEKRAANLGLQETAAA